MNWKYDRQIGCLLVIESRSTNCENVIGKALWGQMKEINEGKMQFTILI